MSSLLSLSLSRFVCAPILSPLLSATLQMMQQQSTPACTSETKSRSVNQSTFETVSLIASPCIFWSGLYLSLLQQQVFGIYYPTRKTAKTNKKLMSIENE
jgi:hypothetical protein